MRRKPPAAPRPAPLFPQETRLADWLEPPSSWVARGVAILGLLAWLFLTFLVVNSSGGTSFGLPHLFYFPILLASTLFGFRGGLLAGLASGLLMGPWMPLSVDAQQQQQTLTWVVRVICFALVGGFAGVLINTIRQHQDRLRWAAFHSAVTGLPNRTALLGAIAALLARLQEQGSAGQGNGDAPEAHTLLLVRVKNFDQIVNALGAHVGSGLILELAKRLPEKVGQPCSVYELDSQKVGLLLCNGPETLEAHVQRTRQLPDQPFVVDGLPIYADLILGAAEVDTEAESPDVILQRANIALAEATSANRHLVHYARQSEAARKKHIELLSDLPHAIERRELFIVYQPKVELETGRTVGVEALLRWQHPVLGLIPPGDFIPLAEETSLIHPLTRLVFDRTAEDFLHLHRSGLGRNLAVNLSARNMNDLQMFEDLVEIYEDHGLELECVELEITESSLLNASQRLLQSIFALRARGMKVSIDDFGTGYTSLSYLADLPVDGIKIDQSFTRKLVHDARTCDIVQAIVELAKKLGLSTVAEGIEDQRTATCLRAMGCDTGQGYFFSRPIPRDLLCRWRPPAPAWL